MKNDIRWVFLLLWLLPKGTVAGVYLTVPEALKKLYPSPAKVEESRAFLQKGQIEKAKTLAGPDVPIESGFISYYEGYNKETLLGTSYLDTHAVRTLNETVLITINPDSSVRQIDILRFDEPPDYLPAERWLEQFKGKKLDTSLSLKGNVHGITGASLTAKSLTLSVRRVLALHQIIEDASP